ncbi:MAG: hypothetical protein ACK4RM_09220 [Flavobacterium sp.]
MKILKYFFLLILLTVVSLTLFIWSKEGKYEIENQIEIPLAQNKVYHFLIDLRNWKSFNHDEHFNTYSFEVENDSNNRGKSNSLIKSIENIHYYESDSLHQRITWFDHEAKSKWKLTTNDNKTVVQWKCSGNLGFFDKCKAFIGNSSLAIKINDIQINNLQKLKESLLNVYTHYEVEIIGKETFKELYFLDKATNIRLINFLEDPNKNIGRFNQFISDNSLELISPVGIRVSFSSANINSAKCTISAWLKEEIFTTPESEIISSTKMNVHFMKIRMKGDYIHIEKAIKTGVDEAAKNEFEIDETSNIILHFNAFYPNVGIPSEWITDIYIPLKQTPVSEL